MSPLNLTPPDPVGTLSAMRVIYKDAVQAHLVPARVMEARGPFGPQPQVEVVETDDSPSFPPGATAQNLMRGLRWFECNRCSEVLPENVLDDHVCEEQ